MLGDGVVEVGHREECGGWWGRARRRGREDLDVIVKSGGCCGGADGRGPGGDVLLSDGVRGWGLVGAGRSEAVLRRVGQDRLRWVLDKTTNFFDRGDDGAVVQVAEPRTPMVQGESRRLFGELVR